MTGDTGFRKIHTYFIGEKSSRKQAAQNARNNLTNTIKSSIFCAPRGFIIFLLGLVSAVHHSISGNEKKKKEGLYAMYHNAIPFLEVICIMVPIMMIMHKKTGKLSNLSSTVIAMISPFICLSTAFIMCMSLRLLGIREDCCGDMNYGIRKTDDRHINDNTFFDAEGNFQGVSFNIPQCKTKKENIPEYFYKYKSEDNKKTSDSKTKFIFYPIYSILHAPRILIQILDLFIRSITDLCTQRELSDNTKKIAQIEIPASFYMIFISIPFCEQKIGRKFNGTIDNYISTTLNQSSVNHTKENTIT